MSVLTWVGTVLSWAAGFVLFIYWVYASASWAITRTAAGAALTDSCIRLVAPAPTADVVKKTRSVKSLGIGESLVLHRDNLGVGRDRKVYVLSSAAVYDLGTTFGEDNKPGFIISRHEDGYHLRCIGDAATLDETKATYAGEGLYEPITKIDP
jgi:hypothetical protein